MTKQERAVRTRRALIVSAATTFGRRGYAEATLQMISSGAGVSPGALHFHFANKAAVGVAVERVAARVLRAVAADSRARHPSGLRALVDTTHALARVLVTDVVVSTGLRLGREPGYASDLDLRREWRRHVRTLLTEAERQGELLPGLPVRRAAAMVVAATIGFEDLGYRDPRWLSQESLDDFWAMVLPAMATHAAVRELGGGVGGGSGVGSGAGGGGEGWPGIAVRIGGSAAGTIVGAGGVSVGGGRAFARGPGPVGTRIAGGAATREKTEPGAEQAVTARLTGILPAPRSPHSTDSG
ncbi:ScbR family autoregulator-binding transcription factor (plasmid) [Streptomyces sp. BI20]|uniref:ScbR family autoregulator-binding transcription factor n=1 Tax=Streptomyces sp. BI20 TaxID=3403460 RepID=UPI003C763F08